MPRLLITFMAQYVQTKISRITLVLNMEVTTPPSLLQQVYMYVFFLCYVHMISISAKTYVHTHTLTTGEALLYVRDFCKNARNIVIVYDSEYAGKTIQGRQVYKSIDYKHKHIIMTLHAYDPVHKHVQVYIMVKKT